MLTDTGREMSAAQWMPRWAASRRSRAVGVRRTLWVGARHVVCRAIGLCSCGACSLCGRFRFTSRFTPLAQVTGSTQKEAKLARRCDRRRRKEQHRAMAMAPAPRPIAAGRDACHN